MKLSDAVTQERVRLEADKQFAREHAYAWCDRSPSYFDHADEYADWFLAKYWFDDAGIEGLPDHTNAWPLWLAERTA